MTPPDATSAAYPYPTQSTDMLNTCQRHSAEVSKTHTHAVTNYHDFLLLTSFDLQTQTKLKVRLSAAAQSCYTKPAEPTEDMETL